MTAAEQQLIACLGAFCRGAKAPTVPYALLKGLICRSLYPHPDHRASADEDLFVLPEHRERCEAVLSARGLVCGDSNDTESKWSDAESGLVVELHMRLFSDDYAAERRMNAYFREAASRCGFETVEDVPVRTFAPQDHFLLLVCHALKHFHYSGFGLRTLCDIGLFATRYGARFEWTGVRRYYSRYRAGGRHEGHRRNKARENSRGLRRAA